MEGWARAPVAVRELHGAFGASAKQASCARWFDAALQFGSKPLFGTNGLKRMQAFCDWAAKRKESTIIIGGHSLWLASSKRAISASLASLARILCTATLTGSPILSILK